MGRSLGVFFKHVMVSGIVVVFVNVSSQRQLKDLNRTSLCSDNFDNNNKQQRQ